MVNKSIVCIVEGTRNNLYITVIGLDGKVILQRSIGHVGLENSSKKTVFGAELLGKSIGHELVEKNILRVGVRVQGKWFKSEKGCISGLGRSGIYLEYIEYMLGSAHNGVRCRKKKRR